MKLKTLLLLQLFYFCLGMGFNVLNYFHLQGGGDPFSPTPPFVGGAVMTVYLLSLCAGYFRYIKIYRGLTAVFVLVLGVYPVVNNLMNFSQIGIAYLSLTTYLAGTGMNAFGLVLNTLSSLKKFEE